MPKSPRARNPSSSSTLDLLLSDQDQWENWIYLALFGTVFSCLLVIFFFPHTVAAIIALSIASIYVISAFAIMLALVVITIKTMITTSDKTNLELPLPTYEEIKQADEKELPSYEEALKKEEQAKLGMNPSQPISSKHTYFESGSPPPYGAFFEKSNSLKPTSTPLQPDIELIRFGSAGLGRG